MKKKVLSVLLAAAMTVSMLTGCGSKPAGNDAQSAARREGISGGSSQLQVRHSGEGI